MQERTAHTASFEVYHKQELIKVFPVNVDRMTIGREQRSSIHLPHPRVSRKHGVLLVDNDGVKYQDNSRAGSVVNGRVIRGVEVEIQHGDNIAIADYLIVYNLFSSKSEYGITDALPVEPRNLKTEWEVIVTFPNGRKKTYPLAGKPFLVGSNLDKNIVFKTHLTEAYLLSLLSTQDGVTLNVDASNVVRLNGNRVGRGLYKISTDDQIRFFGHTLRIRNDSSSQEFKALIGQSAATAETNRAIEMAATRFLSLPVLILGETGTGKDLVARLIHRLSIRRDNPYFAVNCSSITESLAESLLFGHRAGSFTNALADHVGYFERAHRGTLFLDEIGDVPTSIQVKLLRAIENQEIMPVGASEPIKIDVRIIAGTNKAISEKYTRTSSGFRDDLYYRLAGYEIAITPLRLRKDDIPDLIRHFHREMIAQNESLSSIRIPDSAIEVAGKYDWPGNVRELKHETQKAILFADEEVKRIPALRHVTTPKSQALSRMKIHTLLREGKLPEEIMRELKMPRSTFFRLRNQS